MLPYLKILCKFIIIIIIIIVPGWRDFDKLTVLLNCWM